ncbi:DNA-formamidopyrimidine glycosylase family protein [Agromyces mangrovi Wang et al. 2018]|uniref:DNA-formamidopyrimidine glycosylase family protein n=1 Tax=Agromyces mangrovi TaxID=1858653 RepID=UPI0025735B60|nr:DNA-formamidopyrimidine glycosylase family protein [Agromyces mangrovi]BDZ66101.1 putative endonuclease 8 2 [Agromyces mangrovi]
MPEGDTVWRAARRLDEALAGASVTSTDVRVPRYATVDLAGETVHGVAARGKHLLMRIGDQVVHTHLKMDGEWRVLRPGQRWPHPAHRARIVITTPDTVAIGFDLGIVEVFPADEEADRLAYLGPDLLGDDWDAAEAMRRLAAHPEQEIIVALADQRNLAGLGNVYVNELCFLRGLAPGRPVADVELERAVALAERLIRANRDRVARTTTGDTRPGKRLWVHGRGSQPCRRCGTTIRHARHGRTELELRETWWCPHCQT